MIPGLPGAQDVVGVFTQEFKQVFRNARPLKISPKPTNKAMEHPLETGASTVDHVITNPVKVELSLLFNARTCKTDYAEIAQLSQNRTLLIVQCRATQFNNMFIESMPHTEDADIFGTFTMALVLSQAFFVTPQFGTVRNPTNTNTQARGNVQGNDATPEQKQTAGAGFLDYLSGESQ